MSHRFTFPVPTDHAPGGWHAAYMEVYEKLFDSWQREDPVVLLEIGTDGGGGLRAYQEYFPNGYILGIDISPAPEGVKNQPRIVHMQDDAYTKDKINELAFAPRFHIIIDDGPHTLSSQEFFVQNYPNLLTADGIAIVEDIQEWGHVDHLAGMVPDGFFTMGIDLRRNSGRYDDILLAIWRK